MSNQFTLNYTEKCTQQNHIWNAPPFLGIAILHMYWQEDL